MKPKTSTVKLSQVVFDEAIYPRQKHDPKLVLRYAEHIDAIEAKHNYMSLSEDLRLLDGRHRHLGYQTAFPDDPDHEVTVYIYPVHDDDECLDLAAELNSTSGWQLSEDDKRRLAVKMYNRADRKSQEEIARVLSVRLTTVNKWLSSILEQEQKEREDKMLGMWMACCTHESIAESVGLTRQAITAFLQKTQEDYHGKDNSIFRDFEEQDDDETKSHRRVYSVWNFAKATNEVKHFGNIPPEIIDNLIFLYTQPFDVVFDPFGGGGSTIDMCLKRKRRYYVTDLTPIPARDDIRQHDITTGLPKDLPVPDFVFLDPPYWQQAKHKYSKDETDLGNVDLKTFLTTIGNIARDVKRKWSGQDKRKHGYLSLIIGPWKEDGAKVDLALLCYERISKYLPLCERIIVPYSTEVHGGAYVNKAKEAKQILYLHRDLMVFKWQNQNGSKTD